MKIEYLLVICTLWIFVCTDGFSVEMTVDVTVSVLRKLHSSTVCFVHSDQKGILQLPKLVVSIARQGFPTASLFVQMLCPQACVASNPLYVVICSNTSLGNLLTQVTRSRPRSGKWLIFLNTMLSLEEFFARIYLPFDYEFLVAQSSSRLGGKIQEVILTEVFRVNSTQSLQKIRIGDWSHGTGLNWYMAPFVQRRRNLHGVVIKGALRPQAPYTIQTKYKDKKPVEFAGFSVWIFKELQKRMNFQTEYMIPPDGAYGFRNENGTWNGVVGLIVTEKVEIGISLFSSTAERMDIVDYLPPILTSKLAVHIRQPTAEHNTLRHVLSPFSTPLWTVFILVALIIVVALTATRYFGTERDKTDYGIKSSCFHVFGAFCQQSPATMTQSASARLVYVTAYVTGVIMTAAYAATFVSFLTVQRYNLPFVDFAGLLKDGSYCLGVTRGTVHMERFRNSTDSLMRRVYTELMEPEVRSNALPSTDLEGLQRLCVEKKYSFLTLDTSLKGLEADIPCRIVDITYAQHTTTLSMIISKSSEYKTLFKHHLQEMRRTGILKRLVDITWPPNRNEIVEKPPIIVSVDMIINLLLLLAGGITAAIICLILELLGRKVTQSCPSKYCT